MKIVLHKTLGKGFFGSCWCGAKRGWFSVDSLEEGCGGTGTLHCFCGGDQCVCHNHGEVDCSGCEDCDERNYWDDDQYEEELDELYEHDEE